MFMMKVVDILAVRTNTIMVTAMHMIMDIIRLVMEMMIMVMVTVTMIIEMITDTLLMSMDMMVLKHTHIRSDENDELKSRRASRPSKSAKRYFYCECLRYWWR